MAEGCAALIHQLELLLGIEILRNVTDDADQLALPVLKAGRALLDEVEQVLFGKTELLAQLLALLLADDRVVLVAAELRHRAPEIVVGCLVMRPPLFRTTLPLG